MGKGILKKNLVSGLKYLKIEGKFIIDCIILIKHN